MKKVLSVALALLLFLTALTPVLAEEDINIPLEADLLNIFDFSSTEWYSDDEHRTILAACAMFDLILTYNDEVSAIVSAAVLNDSVYVCKKSLSLNIFFFGEEDSIVVMFSPILETAEYFISEGVSSLLAEFAMESLVSKDMIADYYHVDGEAVLEVAQMILETLQE